MAKPPKSGLDYWPRDVGLFQDRKFRRLKSEYGYLALVVYEQLLDMIYSDKGYYLEYDEETKDDAVWDICSVFQGKHQPEPQTIADVIAGLAERGLFDGDCFKRGLITSKRIQKTYYRCTVDRKSIEIDFDIWLLDAAEMESMSKRSLILSEYINRSNNSVNRSNNEVNQPNYPQSKVNESKVNESKAEESKAGEASTNASAAAAAAADIDILSNYEIDKVTEHYRDRIGYGFVKEQMECVKEWLDAGVEYEMIKTAIDEAALEGVKKFSYIKAIVEDKLNLGIKTLDGFRRQKEAYERRKAERDPYPAFGVKKNAFNNYADTNKTDYGEIERIITSDAYLDSLINGWGK